MPASAGRRHPPCCDQDRSPFRRRNSRQLSLGKIRARWKSGRGPPPDSTPGLESAENADRTGHSRRGSSCWAGLDDMSSAREAELRGYRLFAILRSAFFRFSATRNLTILVISLKGNG